METVDKISTQNSEENFEILTHNCGETLEERTVPVDKKVMGISEYPVFYCQNCDVYKPNNRFESKNPEYVGKIITEIQSQINSINPRSKYFSSKNSNTTNQ